MKSYIFIGGEVDKSALTSPIPDDALVIAADSGYDNAKMLGVAERCDFIVGDFDSTKEKAFCSRAKIIRVPSEKNESDAQLAVNLALDTLEDYSDEILIIGGLSGRLDHTLANLYLLEDVAFVAPMVTICDGNNRIRYLKERSSLLIPKSDYKYFGLIPVLSSSKGVTIEGAKYNIKNATISRDIASFAISNEVADNFAMVSVKKGGLFVIESKDLSK